jgi:hypothetical protein
MKRFECQHCRNIVYFDSTTCVSCHHRLGYLPDRFEISALEADGSHWTALAEPTRPYDFCENAKFDACNWLVPAGDGTRFCKACRHNRTIPDLTVASNLANWQKIEWAKNYLFYSLLRWRLPLLTLKEDPQAGLAFDFLVDVEAGDGTVKPVMTGHSGGLITINLAEADDAERERRRTAMGEPYRTLLGHFRHEIAHYYWDRLVRDGGQLERFRAVFGDETRDYGEALQQHYASGPPADWQNSYISAYAASHAWEDFAETWAHYTHIVDGLETARAFGVTIRPSAEAGGPTDVEIDFEPYAAKSAAHLVNYWVPLTVAINSVNRSMGQPDLYPFVLPPPVMAKLQFLHELVHTRVAA